MQNCTEGHNLFQSFLELLPGSSLVFDQNLQLVFLNQSAQKLLSESLNVKLKVGDALQNSEEMHGIRNHLLEVLQGEEALSRVEPVSVFLQDRMVIFEVMTRFAKLEGTRYLITQWSNVTKKRENQMEQSWEASHQSIDLLASGVAHEFNNLLTSISGYKELFQESDQFKDRFLKVVEDGVDRGVHIVNRLLNFAYPEELGEMKTCPPLNQAVKNVMTMLEVELNRRKIRLELELSDEELFPALPPSVLNKFLLDVLTNAIHAIGQDGVIQIFTTKKGNRILLKVKDSGCGMHEKHLRKLFSPFHTTKGSFGSGIEAGKGLALYSLYRILQSYGAEVHVQSAQGLGTLFLLEFLPGELEENC